MLKVIILESSHNLAFGGGDVHMGKLISEFTKIRSVKVTKITVPFKGPEFTALSNSISMIHTIRYPLDNNFRDSMAEALIYIPNNRYFHEYMFFL